MANEKQFTVGRTLPALSFQLTREGNRPWQLVGDETVEFFMRPAWSGVPIVDAGAATIVDAGTDTVTYQWQTADVANPGDYRGWFRVTSPNGDIEETEEFDVIGAQHAPGERARLGAVARAARREIPIDWDMLANLPNFGDAELKEKVELAKLTVLGEEINETAEDSLDRRVIDFIGKQAAVEIIPAAISFWENQIQSQTVRGSAEVASYPNRINALESKQKYLIAVINRLTPTVQSIVGVRPVQQPARPAVDTLGPMVSPGLERFVGPFGGQPTDPRVLSTPQPWNN